jgi:hypothetical protein
MARVCSLCNRCGEGRLSLPEEHVDVAESLEAAAIGLSGGLDQALDDFGAESLVVGRRDTGYE